MRCVFLGIDTSCYTTSVALTDVTGRILLNQRKMLPVKPGACGLRQSDAVFEHIKNLSDFFEQLDLSSYGTIKAVCASEAPRPRAGSYMPVFLVSKAFGQSLASAAGAAYYPSTHQEGHLFSARIDNADLGENYLAVHLSGGTGEILCVCQHDTACQIEIIGKTLDISAGQVIDRVGVKMGYPFPAGNYIEKLAQSGRRQLPYKISVQDTDFNFSGLEAQALRSLEEGVPKPDIALSIQHAVAKTIAQALINAAKKKNICHVLLFGGVIVNEYIRSTLRQMLSQQNIAAFFAGQAYSGDNACGLAQFARNKFLEEHE